jgi:hypothetical protein
VSGAQYLASLGVEVFVLQLLARHAGGTTLRYVKEAPLKNLTKLANQRLEESSINDSLKSTMAQVEKMQRAIEKNQGNYVVNIATGVVHKTLIHDEEVEMSEWLTCCRWPFGQRPHEVIDSLHGVSPSLLCGKCLPVERRDRGEEQMSEDNSSESSSSDDDSSDE